MPEFHAIALIPDKLNIDKKPGLSYLSRSPIIKVNCNHLPALQRSPQKLIEGQTLKTLFLHVGPHKTGTTLLQKFMKDNQKSLSQSGLFYPYRFMMFFGHHELQKKINVRKLSAEDLAFINQHPQNLLFSSENFIFLGERDFDYIRESFSSRQIKIIYSWRRSSYKLYSIWQEYIKHGGTQDFFSYYHEHLSRPVSSPQLSPEIKLNMLSRVFGKENLIILDYDTSLKNNSLVEDFLKTVNILPSPLFIRDDDNPQARNQSKDIEDIEIIKSLNYIIPREHEVQRGWVSKYYDVNDPELLDAGLDELKEIIQDHSRVLNIGNYFVDLRNEQQMVALFSDNMVNYAKNLEPSKLRVCEGSWMLNSRAVELLGDIAQVMKTWTRLGPKRLQKEIRRSIQKVAAESSGSNRILQPGI